MTEKFNRIKTDGRTARRTRFVGALLALAFSVMPQISLAQDVDKYGNVIRGGYADNYASGAFSVTDGNKCNPFASTGYNCNSDESGAYKCASIGNDEVQCLKSSSQKEETDEYGNVIGGGYMANYASGAFIIAAGDKCGRYIGPGYNCNKDKTGAYKCTIISDNEARCQKAQAAQAAPVEYKEKPQIIPRLQIDIPTLPAFSKAVTTKQNGVEGIAVPWLSQYIAAVYRFAIGVAAVLAAVMMMIGGFQWLLARGDSSWVSAGKEKISDAVIGLLLSLGIFVILQIVNPAILDLNQIWITSVPPLEMSADADASDTSGVDVAIKFQAPNGDNIQGPGIKQIPSDLTAAVEMAAVALAKTDAGNGWTYGIYVGSGYRSSRDQLKLIRENCQNPPGSASCKPLAGKPNTCPMQGNPPDPKSCPHTTGHALDLWGMRCKGDKCERCITDWTACNKDAAGMKKCVDDPCQQAIIKALGDQDFCRWTGEAWHFEKPAMSKPCIKG